MTGTPRRGEGFWEFAAIGDVEAGELSSLVKEEWLRQ
jgi:hypothetical protein